MTTEDIHLEGQAGRLGKVLTAVVVPARRGKAFRLPTEHELRVLENTEEKLAQVATELPFGLPLEPTPKGGGRRASRAFSIQSYGLTKWTDLFTARQLLTVAAFANQVRLTHSLMLKMGYDAQFAEAVSSYLACVVDKLADYNSDLVPWQPGGAKGGNTFARWALPIKWDFAENNVFESRSGGWNAVLDWVTSPIEGALDRAARSGLPPKIILGSCLQYDGTADLIVTDPPYYDSIPYSDCMDFFYVWLRRMLSNISDAYSEAFKLPLSPKWDNATNDGEIIDDDTRQDGSAQKSKNVYEDAMFRAFRVFHKALSSSGRLVIVFAHKDPEAWETLVTAMIRAGFVVEASWPIQTEMSNRTRAMTSSALSSSVWLVCRRREGSSMPGWDNIVYEEMKSNIYQKLHQFWDAGIRGPDFVWAATGPALEIYSKHPVVKKANVGGVLSVGEFLSEVRRIVVDYVVGRVLTGNSRDAIDSQMGDRLDSPTSYYLLHRHDFALDDAPSGACILYAISCGLSDRELASTWNLISYTKGGSSAEEVEEENSSDDADPDETENSGSKIRLKAWSQRKGKSMGFDAPAGKPVPLIDRIHRLMHLWKQGDLHKVDDYIDSNALRRQELFKRVLQAIIELSSASSEERSLLESLSNHIHGKAAAKVTESPTLFSENN